MKKFATILFLFLVTFTTQVTAQNAFVNEIHYDNATTDVNEMVEVAVLKSAMLDLTLLQVVLYNGTGGVTYDTDAVSTFTAGAVVPTDDYQLYSFIYPANGIQNGAPDGWALVYNGTVLEFLTYEGTMTATNGPASGMTSTDIGVSEPGTDAAGLSLQRTGSTIPGTWTGPVTASPGTVNAGQSLPIELAGFGAKVSDNEATIHWTTASESNNDRFEVQHKVGNAWKTVATLKGAGTSTISNNYAQKVSNLEAGYHAFRLKQVDYDGSVSYSDEIRALVELNTAFQLGDAYPNPFNPTTSFSLTVAQDQNVKVEVYDLAGRLVQTLFSGTVAANEIQHFTFEASALSSGTYLYRVVGDKFVTTKAFRLLK